MGTVVSPVIYLALLLPVAWAICAPVRRRIRRPRALSRIRIRVYPGSPEHLAALRAVDEGRSPQHRFRVWDEVSGSWVSRSGRRPVVRR